MPSEPEPSSQEFFSKSIQVKERLGVSIDVVSGRVPTFLPHVEARLSRLWAEAFDGGDEQSAEDTVFEESSTDVG